MGKKILHCDDTAEIRVRVKSLLEAEGFEVITARDGKEALEKFQSTPDILLVISDVIMPNMTGIELLKALKADPKNGDLPILMLSSDVHPAQIQRAKKAGMIGWLKKPYEDKDLIATVRKLAG